MTNWVTMGMSNAGRPWTAVNGSDGSALLLAQLIDGWWFLRTEEVTGRSQPTQAKGQMSIRLYPHPDLPRSQDNKTTMVRNASAII
ncbi:hypothetical protein [Micromonospora sicca]|uniref:hypothetical protein n=1 Tax=Micromonospora sicca TaxID=2202420 RepID=UPI0011B6DC7C|nr:hypothetical protein [Micromonospora sp. 4G51]